VDVCLGTGRMHVDDDDDDDDGGREGGSVKNAALTFSTLVLVTSRLDGVENCGLEVGIVGSPVVSQPFFRNLE
jgi:hypothetical protein